MWQYNYSDELYHYGVKGMRWGHRKRNYYSTGIRSAAARRSNEKVDKGFDQWKENDRLKNEAIDLGKKRNDARRSYESNRSDKTLKSAYKSANRDYKKALRRNTTYRKGVVRHEVGKDASRKYLSDAKKVGKQLDKDPTNRDLKKQYNYLMSKHDVERARARRAVEVASNRSKKKASMKRAMTIGIKSAAATAAIAGGTAAANYILRKHNVTLNGRALYVSGKAVRKYAEYGKKIIKMRKYF